MSSNSDIFSELSSIVKDAIVEKEVQESENSLDPIVELIAEKDFIPATKNSIAELGLPYTILESLVLKFLLVRSTAWGHDICAQLKLPFSVITELMRQMKAEQLVAYKNSTSLSDYNYELTVAGADRAQRDYKISTYFGAVPVTYSDYLDSVEAQSLDKQTPSIDRLKVALGDLLMPPEIFNRVGQAINSARAMFLYGAPGNGKTSIAQRLCQAFGESIWIPRALIVEDQIVRLFDPALHQEIPVPPESNVDQRWALIKRPTIVAGGELKLEHLEMSTIGDSGVIEAPLQMKSNCGTFLVDDFGRQQMTTTELLNRWILPLETRCDYLSMPGGKKIRVPFDQMVIFSTNLEPKELVDEAFLRRIPYKINAPDPTVEEFSQLFKVTAEQLSVSFSDEALAHLLLNCYETKNRPMRFCHPRDLLSQVKSYCNFVKRRPEMTIETMNEVVANYFVD